MERETTQTAPASRVNTSHDQGPFWRLVLPIFAILALIAAYLLAPEELPREVKPLKAKKLSQLPHFQGTYRERMLWGTYNSGLYLGMRTKEPYGLQAGLMWFDPQRPNPLENIRHQAQDRDGLRKFGWESHNGESYGRQELHDGKFHITTSFVKTFQSGSRGGDWGLRISMQPSEMCNRDIAEDGTKGSEQCKISLLFYIADLQEGDKGRVSLAANERGETYILASGENPTLGEWNLHAISSTGEKLPRLRYLGMHSQHLHDLSDAVATRMAQPSLVATSGIFLQGRRSRPNAFGVPWTSLPDEVDHDANVAVFQMTGSLPLSVDLVFTGSLKQPPRPAWLTSFLKTPVKQMRWPAHPTPKVSLKERLHNLSGMELTKLLLEEENKFSASFAAKFGALEGGSLPKGTRTAAQAALSNMLGGIGYFYGSSLVRIGEKVVESFPTELLTAVPSRSFFPRGFLWDEGFHMLLVRAWSKRLSRDILAHWLDLLNSEGWMAREQILGEDARARVPPEFLVQDPKAANPPTLFLVLADMARSIAEGKTSNDPDTKEDLDFLSAAFPRLEAWLDWFIQSQQGRVEGSWRWQGRELDLLPDPLTGQPTSFSRELNPKTLTSGLDDYPRASHPSEDERHLDLYCWMATAASSMTSIAKSLGLKSSKISSYGRIARQLGDLQHLNAMHYDKRAGQYRDWGNHTEDVRLDWRYISIPEQWQSPGSPNRRRHDFVRFVGTPPKPSFVPHFGYVSLFPVMMRILPAKSPELASQLHHLRTGQIMTSHGLRSLSLGSSLHGKRNTEHDPPYWRGPVWMNLNFMMLAALDHYAKVDGPQAFAAKQLHDTLRESLLTTLVTTYEESGYLWENYDEETGAGRGCRPFTGWTALLVLISSRVYPQI